jgi:ATP-binding cassette subfamily F protein uup
MAELLIGLNGVALNFGGDPVLEDVSLTIGAGDRLCLVGRNGSGKSTLMKLLAGEIEPDQGERVQAERSLVTRLEQDPDFTGFSTLGDYVAGGAAAGDDWRLAQVLGPLAPDAGLDPAKASGGERRRAALARALARGGDLLLLDEPTNHLDIAMIAWLEEQLLAWKGALVVVSHDRSFLRRVARGMLWLDRGVLRRLDRGFDGFEDWRDRVFAEEDSARHKRDRLIAAESRWAVEGISARRKRNQGRVRRLARMRDERAAELRRAGTAALRLEVAGGSGRRVIEAERLSKDFGSGPVIRDLSLTIGRGECVAIAGPNGAGKTTLIGLLTGEIAPDRGRLRLGTGLVTGWFRQNREELDLRATPWEILTGDPATRVPGRHDQVMVGGTPRHVLGYLKDFLFSEAQARGPVAALSGGEKARLVLARLMARPANLLVLDEPTNDLDVETLDLLEELIGEFAGTVLLVSHDRDFIDRVAGTTVVLGPGGTAGIYAGGWSDALAQGAVFGAETAVQAKPAPKTAVDRTSRPGAPAGGARRGLSFTERHRLARLPEEIGRLTSLREGLERNLGEAGLWDRDPARFSGLAAELERVRAELARTEDEWLALAVRDEGPQG